MIELNLQVRPAGLQDRESISSLIFYGNHAHRHLDWRPPLDWLGEPPFWLVEEDGRVLAALACPMDPPGVAWVRLFVSSGTLPTGAAWSALWEAARQELARRGGASVGVIDTQGWFGSLLAQSGFQRSGTIVMLEWMSRPVLPHFQSPGVRLRPMTSADLPEVSEVDAEAFDPFWHYSLDTLSRAFSQTVIAAVAESNGRMLGYQLSVANPTGAHLARLAVRKEAQGLGLGQALVADLLAQIRMRGAQRVTVNTQSDNAASLALYRRMGFVRTGQEYPVFRYLVHPTGG